MSRTSTVISRNALPSANVLRAAIADRVEIVAAAAVVPVGVAAAEGVADPAVVAAMGVTEAMAADVTKIQRKLKGRE